MYYKACEATGYSWSADQMTLGQLIFILTNKSIDRDVMDGELVDGNSPIKNAKYKNNEFDKRLKEAEERGVGAIQKRQEEMKKKLEKEEKTNG